MTNESLFLAFISALAAAAAAAVVVCCVRKLKSQNLSLIEKLFHWGLERESR